MHESLKDTPYPQHAPRLFKTLPRAGCNRLLPPSTTIRCHWLHSGLSQSLIGAYDCLLQPQNVYRKIVNVRVGHFRVGH
jgi:hypothetical protein